MEKIALTIENKKMKYEIPAVLTVGEKDNVPLVVLIHGTGSSKDEVGDGYPILAEKLAKQNIASIRFDFAGCGEHKMDYIRYDLQAALSDVECVIEEAKKQINVKNVSVLGWSQGGTVALLSAMEHPEYASVVTWAGALSMDKMLDEGQVKEIEENGYVTMYYDFRGPANFSLKWYREVCRCDIVNRLHTITSPVLAIAGDKDDVVDPKEAEIIAANVVNGQCCKIAGADHIYNILWENETFDKMSDITVNWLAEKTK